MRCKYSLSFRLITAFIMAAGGTANVAAQGTASEGGSSAIWFYLFVILLFGIIGSGFIVWRRSQNAKFQTRYNYPAPTMSYNGTNGTYDMDSVDALVELEWLRKAKKSTTKGSQTMPAVRERLFSAGSGDSSPRTQDLANDAKVFQEKMRKLQYAQLPINSFSQLAPAKNYQPLPISNDPALLTAIEQANEEYEEDEAIRNLAVRILTAFRNQNSLEALSQIALYDLSANLRSKAVTTLAEFDHESVFETILLACADPTREVRAAAARGLFRLNFDRAHAWKRLIETDDEYRMNHAARAATESGIVVKSFDRLIHEDLTVAYEAFALVSLLIKAGETSEIFNALRHHKDERVKFALLHVLRVQRDERTLLDLNTLRAERKWPDDVAERLRETVASFKMVAA